MIRRHKCQATGVTSRCHCGLDPQSHEKSIKKMPVISHVIADLIRNLHPPPKDLIRNLSKTFRALLLCFSFETPCQALRWRRIKSGAGCCPVPCQQDLILRSPIRHLRTWLLSNTRHLRTWLLSPKDLIRNLPLSLRTWSLGLKKKHRDTGTRDRCE
jgi:hypothetical protein